MKLDRKEILAVLETITVAGEGKTWWKAVIQNVLTLEMKW